MWDAECSEAHVVSTHCIGLTLAQVHRALAHLGAALLLRRTSLPAEDLCGAIHGTPAALRPPDGRGDRPPAGVRPTGRRARWSPTRATSRAGNHAPYPAPACATTGSQPGVGR